MRNWQLVIVCGLLSAACGSADGAVLAAFVPQVSPVTLADPEQTYLDALRERRLYRVLELYCRKQLARPEATPAERARYTIELANMIAVRAQSEPQAAARVELWQQASTLLRMFLDENPRHSQAAALLFQLGVYELAQGELTRQQAKVFPDDKGLIESARDRLRSAVQSFRSVESDATQAMRKRSPADAATDDQPSYKQLLALVSTTRFRLGTALLALAETYPRHSADQTEAASQAKTQFEAFTQRYSPNELVVESYLGRAECLRLLGDPAEAARSLKEVERPGTPEKYLDRALILRAQLQFDQRKPEAARDFIEDARKLMKGPNAELDLLHVQSLLEIARKQSQGQGNLVARQLVSMALEEMDRMEREHGAYWVSRCELLLAELAADNVLVEDPAVLVRMADGQFRRGDRAGTVRTLDRAVKLALERGDEHQTAELSFRAASILVQERQFEEAAARFAQITSTHLSHAKAAQAQFMVAYCLGQMYAADPTAERLDKYARSLEQVLRLFSNDQSAFEARWLLGSLRMNQRRWSEAIELLKGIPREHGRFTLARSELGRAYESWLGDLWSASQPADRIVAEAMEFFKEALSAAHGTKLRADDVPLALRLGRILRHPTVGRYQEAEQLAEQILFGEAATQADRGEARRLTVEALLGQDKFEEARRMIENEFVGLPQELFAVVQALEDVASRSTESRRRQMGKLQLAATERLVKQADQLTPDQSLQAELYLALAYVNAGEAARADELFAKLHDRLAGNPRVLEAQAECFMQLGRYAQARELWRQFLGLVRENTPAWYRAKYNLARACYLAGDPAQALKIIQVTELLHPELGGPELKTKFEELKAKCQAGR